MRRKRITILATVLLVTVGSATAIYGVTHVMRKDHVPPKITMDSEAMDVSVSYTQEDLLRGVTAKDNRDGDVTGEIVVESISEINPDHMAVATYAAFDHSGNVSKATRTLTFTDYQPPKFSQKEALLLPEGSTQDVLGYMGAQDMIDGDISSRIKGNLVSDTTSLAYAGVHQVEFRVTNTMGDTVRITLPVDVHPTSAYDASVELSEYLVYIPKGTVFHAEKYLKNLTVGSVDYQIDGHDPDIDVFINRNGQSDARHTVRVDMIDNVDTRTPGVYSVTYTVTMDDLHTGFTRLNVVVEE